MAVVIRSMQQAALTAGGPTQDFEISDFGNITPGAALVFGGAGVTNGTTDAHARFSIGLTDGTRQRCVSVRSRNSQTNSGTQRNGLNDSLWWMYSTGAVPSALGAAAFSSFANNKLVLNYSTLASSAWPITAVLFGGSDFTGYCNDFTGNATQDLDVPITDFAFEWDLLIFVSRGASGFVTGGTGISHASISIGFAIWNGSSIEQKCFSFTEEHNVNPARVGARVYSDRVAANLLTGGPLDGASLEVTERTGGGGFRATTRGASTALVSSYLACKFNGALQGLSLDAHTTRTTTGADSFTTPGFAAQAILGIFSRLTALDSLNIADAAGSWGFGVMTGATEEFSAAYMSDDALSPTSTKSLSDNVGISVPTQAGAAGYKANLTGFTHQGGDLSYANADGNANQMLLLTVGRNAIRANAKGTSGAVEKAIPKVPHAARGKAEAGTEEKAVGAATHTARGGATGGDVARAVGAGVHAGRASAIAGVASRAQGIKAALARGVGLVGSVLRSIPALVGGGGSTTLTTVADARVGDANPTSNFGSSPTLRVREQVGDVHHTYLRFDLSSVSGTISSATLRLWCTDGSPVAGVAYVAASGSWTEAGITWNNAPGSTGSAVATVGNVNALEWAEWDVTSALSGSQLDLVLKSTSTNSAVYDSKEATNAPELVVVTVGGGSTIFAKGVALGGAIARAVAMLAAGGRVAVAAGSTDHAAGAAAHAGRGWALADGGSRASGAAQHAPRGRGLGDSGARASGAAQHFGRGRESGDGAARATGRAVHGGRAADLAGTAPRAAPRKSALARAISAVGSVIRAAPQHIVAGGTTLFGKGVSVAGVVVRAVALKVSGARGRAAAGSVERGQGRAAHAGRARTSTGAAERSVGAAPHAGRGRSVASGAERAAGKGTHGGRARTAAGSLSRGRAFHAAIARAVALVGAVLRAQGLKASAGVIVARGVALSGSVARAVARVAHMGRGRTIAGMVDPTTPSVVHRGRGRTVAGAQARAFLSKPLTARARAIAGAVWRAVALKFAKARAADTSGEIDRARAVKRGGGRVSAATLALLRARAQAVHSARARTVAGAGARAIYSRVVLGFYGRTGKAVRTRWRQACATALGIPTQYSNLKAVIPPGVVWARVVVTFSDFDEAGVGGAGATYIVPGALEVELRAPLLSGVQAVQAKAQACADALERREVSGVVYGMAELGSARHEGDEWRLALRVPFRAADLLFAPPASDPQAAGDGFADSETAIRTRFRQAITDGQSIPTSHDNLRPDQATGAPWIRLQVIDAGSFNVDGPTRRSSGVMLAEVHVPLHSGEGVCLEVADRVVESFRMVSAGPVRFSFPYLRPARQKLGEWVQPVYCPWTADHA